MKSKSKSTHKTKVNEKKKKTQTIIITAMSHNCFVCLCECVLIARWGWSTWTSVIRHMFAWLKSPSTNKRKRPGKPMHRTHESHRTFVNPFELTHLSFCKRKIFFVSPVVLWSRWAIVRMLCTDSVYFRPLTLHRNQCHVMLLMRRPRFRPPVKMRKKQKLTNWNPMNYELWDETAVFGWTEFLTN